MQQQPYWIGVDLHTRVIQASVLDKAGEVILEERHDSKSLEEGCEFVS